MGPFPFVTKDLIAYVNWWPGLCVVFGLFDFVDRVSEDDVLTKC